MLAELKVRNQFALVGRKSELLCLALRTRHLGPKKKENQQVNMKLNEKLQLQPMDFCAAAK